MLQQAEKKGGTPWILDTTFKPTCTAGLARAGPLFSFIHRYIHVLPFITMMDYANRYPILHQKLSSLGPVGPAAWDAIASRLETIHCRPNRSLPVHPGDALFLFEGLLKEEMDVDDRLSIHQFVQAGDFFLAPMQPPHTYFVAIEPSIAGKISRRGLYELNGLYPELASVYDHIISRSHQQLTQRIRLLLLPKNDRYNAFTEDFPALAARLLDKDILRYLDISPGYFSRTKG